MEGIRLAELCATTSLFTDLGSGQPVEHGLQTCLVAMRLAGEIGCDDDELRDVLYVSLLRFLGCTAASHELADLGGGDERHILGGMATVTMGTAAEELLQLARIAAPGVSRWRRARILLSALSDPAQSDRLLGAHCEAASRLAGDIGLPSSVCVALEHGYARWDGEGVPDGVGGEAIPRALRISVIARDIELWAREAGDDAAVRTMRARRGRAYDPTIVDTALSIGVGRLRRVEADLWQEVLSLEPDPPLAIGGSGIDDALRALGDFADLKHPSLTGHSRRVERIVAAACRVRGFDRAATARTRRAASVHDVGVVAVPVRAFERPADRTVPVVDEQLRVHPIWSQRLLARCTGLESVAVLAARHHERTDGSGYPAGLKGAMDSAAGLLASAVAFDEAVHTDERGGDVARRAGVDRLVGLAGEGRLDSSDVSAIIEAAGEHAPLVDVERPAGLSEREVQVLRLIATGHTNRQIATRLGITARTVGAHVEHIYDKVGVGSRAAATLFAAQHDLIT